MFDNELKKIKSSSALSGSSSENASQDISSNIPNSDMLGMLGAEKKLPGGVQKKMESSFGADFSNVRIYESPAIGQMGAEAFAKGNIIGFDSGKFNPSSQSGQELLGHELSHVVSQGRGEVKGGKG
ncbi:MAG: DUF4157 domain-containing protein, partial [Firmicutes bacterium]|nr:DUF4157 domain-containing protein [Bacillota bacterium]